jgi:hypothetical protein
MPVISALERLKQENCEFEASLGYIARPFLERKKEREKERKKERKKEKGGKERRRKGGRRKRGRIALRVTCIRSFK